MGHFSGGTSPAAERAICASPFADGARAGGRATRYPRGVSTTLLRDLALVDHERGRLSAGQSILVRSGRVVWIRPRDAEEDPGPDCQVVDASGTTAVPGMVDSHSHLTLPGGAHWMDRALDPTAELARTAEENAGLLHSAGVRWVRDVGSPDREGRPLALTLRDRWRGRPAFPEIRAAGTWITRAGSLPSGYAVEVEDGEGLLAAGRRQLDMGADMVKLYMDGPDPEESPFTESEVAALVVAAERRGSWVTAHSGTLVGARVAVRGGVASLEHGFQLDRDLAEEMAARGVALVSTLAVLESWRGFATTTTAARFASGAGRAAVAARREWARHAVRLADEAGVLIAAGTDFGGGSLRANQLAWEVQCLVECGMDPIRALAAATINGGRLLREPEAGRLREGGPADIVLVHGDPISDPAALWRVWRVLW